ncbi:hypothetical protein ABZP36_035585 [Zizania latifolia]
MRATPASRSPAACSVRRLVLRATKGPAGYAWVDGCVWVAQGKAQQEDAHAASGLPLPACVLRAGASRTPAGFCRALPACDRASSRPGLSQSPRLCVALLGAVFFGLAETGMLSSTATGNRCSPDILYHKPPSQILRPRWKCRDAGRIHHVENHRTPSRPAGLPPLPLLLPGRLLGHFLLEIAVFYDPLALGISSSAVGCRRKCVLSSGRSLAATGEATTAMSA